MCKFTHCLYLLHSNILTDMIGLDTKTRALICIASRLEQGEQHAKHYKY